MANKRIVIRLIGSDSHGDVRLLDFIEELEAFSEALRQTERVLSGGEKPSLYYKVVDLSHGSPATVVIEAVRSSKDSPVAPSKVVKTFVSDVRSLRKKKAPAKVDLAMLEAYRDLAVPLQKHMRTVEIVETGKKVVPIDNVFTENVQEVIGPDLFSYGSVSGRLERVNFHNVLRFEIYPSVGPRRVRCEFRSDQKQRVKEALDNFVTVYGRLRYKKWDKYPHAVDVRPGGIVIHEENKDLPSLHDLRGIAPEATGEMSAEEFVRSIRDDNW